MRKKVFIFLFFAFSFASVNARESFGLRLEAGYYPNVLHMGETDFFLYLKGVQQRMLSKPSELQTQYGNKVSITDVVAGKTQLSGIPVGIHFDYIFRFFFVRMGFIYNIINSDYKAYTLTTSPGADGAHANFYDDYRNNNDGDLENDVEAAKGLIPTDGKPVRFEMTASAVQWELPLVLGIYLINNEFSNFYVGLGGSYFYGQFNRSIRNSLLSGENSGDDIDRFSGQAVGFTMLAGGEIRLSKRVGMYMEFVYNVGAVLPLIDEVHTGSSTTNSLFHHNNEQDLGGPEGQGELTRPGIPKLGGLQFIHYRFVFGLHYYLRFDRNEMIRQVKPAHKDQEDGEKIKVKKGDIWEDIIEADEKDTFP